MGAQSRSGQLGFPPGGITPVFNEVTILLAISPKRPEIGHGSDEIGKYGVCERVVMKNPIDEKTGIVQPTVFYRGDTFVDPNTGLRTQPLLLVQDRGRAVSKIFGGELGMNVKPPFEISPKMTGFPAEMVEIMRTQTVEFPHATIPREVSVGRIQALQPHSDFPARVFIPVYYAFVSGGSDGKLATAADNFSIEAKEPHSMTAVVVSVPPDPHICVSATEWNLIDDSAYLKLWVKVECFRFLGIGDWETKKRYTYRDGKVVQED